MIIRTPHAPDPDHLEDVRERMAELGPPRIHAYYDTEIYWALEGSHRVAAAHDLGLRPELVLMDPEDEIEHDFEDVPGRTVADLLDYLSGGMPDPDTYYYWEQKR